MKIPENVDGERVQGILDQHAGPKQGARSDRPTVFNVVKGMRYTHIPEIAYPKQDAPKYDALEWINILASNANVFILGTYHRVMKSTCSVISMNSAIVSADDSGQTDRGFDRPRQTPLHMLR